MNLRGQIGFILVLAVAAYSTSPAYGGRVGLVVKGTKAVMKATAKEIAKESAEKLMRQQTEHLVTRYSRRAIESAEQFAEESKINKKTLLRMIEDHGDVLARHSFSDESLMFASKHGGAGVFFLRHPSLFEGLKKSTDLAKVDHSVIVQAWRWGDEKAIGGSLHRLQKSLQGVGMNSGVTRDFCEDLFIIRARTGKIPGIPNGSELIKGHVGGARQGIDALLPENGKLRVIEFGTGKKPIPGEMSWGRIKSNLADFFEGQSLDNWINLRGKGFPVELVNNPARIRSPDFPIEKYVQREVYATSINRAEIARAGGNIVCQTIK